MSDPVKSREEEIRHCLDEESLREYARSVLGGWLARKSASAGSPTAEQAVRLRASIKRASLPPDLGWMLAMGAVFAFVASYVCALLIVLGYRFVAGK